MVNFQWKNSQKHFFLGVGKYPGYVSPHPPYISFRNFYWTSHVWTSGSKLVIHSTRQLLRFVRLKAIHPTTLVNGRLSKYKLSMCMIHFSEKNIPTKESSTSSIIIKIINVQNFPMFQWNLVTLCMANITNPDTKSSSSNGGQSRVPVCKPKHKSSHSAEGLSIIKYGAQMHSFEGCFGWGSPYLDFTIHCCFHQ